MAASGELVCTAPELSRNLDRSNVQFVPKWTSSRAVQRDRFGLFCSCCEAPEIHVRCRGKINEGRPDCDGLIELLGIDLVERVVRGVMGVEIVQPILAQ